MFVDDLDGDEAVQRAIEGLVDHPHTAFCDFFLDEVFSRKDEVRHQKPFIGSPAESQRLSEGLSEYMKLSCQNKTDSAIRVEKYQHYEASCVASRVRWRIQCPCLDLIDEKSGQKDRGEGHESEGMIIDCNIGVGLVMKQQQ